MRSSAPLLFRFLRVLLTLGSAALAGCTFAPAPVPQVGEGPPAKFDVAVGQATDAAALSDGATKADAPRLDSSDSADGLLPGSDAAAVDATAADGASVDVDPADALAADIEDQDAMEDADSDDAAKPDAPPDGGGADVVQPPGFGAVWTQVLAKYGCTAAYCHGKTADQPIFASQALSYAMLVQEAGTAEACVGVPLVTIGKPEASLLWQKIAPDTPTCGLKMPVTAENNGLDPASAALVAAWIKGGAKP